MVQTTFHLHFNSSAHHCSGIEIISLVGEIYGDRIAGKSIKRLDHLPLRKDHKRLMTIR